MRTIGRPTVVGAVVAGLATTAIALAPTAVAGGPSSARYSCTSAGVTSSTTITVTTSYPHMTPAPLPIATGISFSETATVSITVWDSKSSSLVTYSATKVITSNGTSITIGPLPVTAGKVSAGDPLHTSKPGTINPVTISIAFPSGTTTCTPLSDFSPPLTA